MGNLANIAKQEFNKKSMKSIKNDEIIKLYPGGVTINGTFMLKSSKGVFPCFTFAEDEAKFFYASSYNLKKLYEMWLKSCGDDMEELNKNLQYENVRVQLSKEKIENGNKTVVNVLVIGSVEKPRIEVDEESGEIYDTETGEILNEEEAPF